MTKNNLVKVTRYSLKIKELSIIKRIDTDYPLLCRDDVAKKLALVAENLPQGLLLQVDSAYRTLNTQQTLWKIRSKTLPILVYNPAKGTPPHTTGGAVDVTLTDAKGKELNLSEPFEKYYMEPQLISAKITPRAQELRNILSTEMQKAGFAPHPQEYWHFSYGDRNWAGFTGQSAIYEQISLDPSQYFQLSIRVFFKLARKLWKLLGHLVNIQTNY